MRAFVAYRSSGADRQSLLSFLSKLQDALHEAGVEPYITDLQDSMRAPLQSSKILAAFEKIDDSDMLICIMRDGDMSEGMLLEIGYTYKKRAAVLFLQEQFSTKAADLAGQVVTWRADDDLLQKIRKYDFQAALTEHSR